LRYLHFADICIDTHNHLLYRQNEAINLAPKVYDLLVFLCQNSHRVISKDELMEQVWTGTLVTENAISRTLVKVRKALADDPKNPQFIITVPRKGYRMVADFVTSETANNQPKKLEKDSNNLDENLHDLAEKNGELQEEGIRKNGFIWKYKNISIISVGLILLIAITFALSSSKSTVLQTKQVKPLTREVGVELYPALSPDLTHLAYSKQISGKPSYINIENLKTHAKLSISHARGALSKPVWSPTEDKLAFLYQHNSVCMIFLAEIDNIKNKEYWLDVTECGAQSNPHFVFSPDGKSLYFNDRQSASHGYQIFRVNLSNNEKDIVNQPITNGLGNYSFDISDDGEKLVMINSAFSPTTRIYTLDVNNSTLKQTAQLDYLMRSVIWHHDNKTIIHPSPHPAYEVWQSNLAGTKLAVVASNTSRVKHLSRLNNGKDFTFVSYLLNRDIYFQGFDKPTVALDNSTVMDYLPTLANNSKQYAFVSKRSTSAEVYLSDLQEVATTDSAIQLSAFNNPIKLYDLAFSPNDSQLMILADNQIYIASINSKAIVKLPIDDIAIVGVSWQDENNLLLSTVKNADWTLMNFNIEKAELSRLNIGYQGGIYSTVDDNFYFIADDSYQVIKFSDLSTMPQAIDLTCQPSIINRKLNLKVTPTGLACSSSEEEGQYNHYSFALQSSQSWQKPSLNDDFDINNAGVIYTRMQRYVADIMQTTSL